MCNKCIFVPYIDYVFVLVILARLLPILSTEDNGSKKKAARNAARPFLRTTFTANPIVISGKHELVLQCIFANIQLLHY